MLKVDRPALDAALRADLDRRQADVDARRAVADPWTAFNRVETALAERGQPTVRAALAAAFHGKCGYCESSNGSEIDHHLPTSPHKHNGGRGSPRHLFQWQNLVWSCGDCNGIPIKGAHMEWEVGGRPTLLDPTVRGDDPLCYFAIREDELPSFAVGWIDPQEGLNAIARRRAEYTLRRLKLNLRKHLVDARGDVLRRFRNLEYYLERLGPDFGAPDIPSVRDNLVRLLSPQSPHLALVRQLLRRDPARRQRLVNRLPELGPLIDQWDLPPDDCVAVRAPPAAVARRR